MPKKYTATDKYTGKKYTFDWDRPNEPTDDDIDRIIRSQINKTAKPKPKSLWQRASEPLTDLPSRAARTVSSGISNLRRNTDNPYLAGTLGFFEGATEGAGDVATSMTAPLDLAATASGLGGLARTNRALSGLTALRGADNMYSGAVEGDVSKIGAGAVETGLSALGMRRQPKMSYRPGDTIEAEILPESQPKQLGKGDTTFIGDARGNVAKYKGKFDPYDKYADMQPIMEGEVLPPLYEPPKPAPVRKQLPGQQKALPPAEGPSRLPQTTPRFLAYDDILAPDDLSSPKKTFETMNKVLAEGERKGVVQNKYGTFPKGGKPVYSGPKQLDPMPDLLKAEDIPFQKPNKESFVKSVVSKLDENNIPDPKRPYKKIDENTLKGWAAKGDVKAKSELSFRTKSKRPNLGSEKGAVATDIFKVAGEGVKAAGKKIADTVNLNMIERDTPIINKVRTGYKDWVNERAARKAESFNVRQDFKDLDNLGMEGIFAYNKGDRSGRFADMEKWFNDMHSKLESSGLKIGFKENYLPQIWDNTKEEVAQAFKGKRLTLKPRIAFHSIIDTYEQGIKLGLTPKYKTIPELMGFYSEIAHKSLADRKFFQYLKDNKLVARHGSKEDKLGWIQLPGDIFPEVHTKDGKIAYSAPPEIHAVVDNYLREPKDFTRNVLNGIQFTKDVALASGIPGTAFSAHGFNMLRRSSAINGTKGFVQALKYMSKSGSDANVVSKTLNKVLPWQSADDTIMKNRQLLPEITKYGGRLGVEGHEFGDFKNMTLKAFMEDKSIPNAAKLIAKKHSDWFETHLFDKLIPALKIDYYKSTVDDLVKSGKYNPDQARREAAKAMNLAFSNINYDELATNKDMLTAAKMLFLAPDWYASNVGLAKNIGQSVLDSNHQGAKLYKQAARGLLGMYVLANVANAITTWAAEGKPKLMTQNESGQTLSIDTGAYSIKEDGTKKKVYINPFGTAFDMFKIPYEMAAESFKWIKDDTGDAGRIFRTLRNRLNLPAHSLNTLIANSDRFGNPLYGRDRFGRQIPGTEQGMNIVKEMAQPFTPSYIKGIGGYLTEEMTPLESASQTIEAPLTFRTQSNQSSSRRRRSRPSRSRP